MTIERTSIDTAAAAALSLQHDHPLSGWLAGCPTCSMTQAEAFRLGYLAGRDSVGLGDFLPDPCGEEERAPNYHFVETYGEWLDCSRGRGHDGEHEHSDSGFTWPQDPGPQCRVTRDDDGAQCRHHGDGEHQHVDQRGRAIEVAHSFSPDQLIARSFGLCWHSPTSDRWPCQPGGSSLMNNELT